MDTGMITDVMRDAVGVVLVAGGWMLTTLQEYTREVFDLMTQI